ncbi:MAG: PilZ domain-containing protein [Magnetococcales bacterium]|nr:PilZ domain-containing protein [Magnetococcales bacterium]
MIPQATTPPPPVRPDRPRAEARIPFHTRMRLEIALGEVIEGFTVDVSMSGAFMETDTSASPCAVGDKGVVFLEMKEGNATYEVSFPCQVARVNVRGIGLDFESAQ